MKTISRLALPAAVLCLVSLGASAATRHVEPWGTDNDTCGNASQPCRTIQYTITQRGSAGTRVLVGPGIYRENIRIKENAGGESLRGLRLESTHGRHATILLAANPGDNLIRVSTFAVRIGSRSRGFTLAGASTSGSAAIMSVGAVPGLRIEGNLVRDNYLGVRVQGAGIQVRHNLVENNASTGIDCGKCERARIEDNEVTGSGGDGFVFWDNPVGMLMRANRSAGNAAQGIVVDQDVRGLVLLANAMEGNGTAGVQLWSADDLTVQKNVIGGNASTGFVLTNHAVESRVQMQDNLVLDNRSIGAVISDTGILSMERNGFVQNSTYGLYLGGTSAQRFQQNLTYANGSGCGMFTTVALVYSQHFFGDPGGPDNGFDGDGIDTLCGNLATDGSYSARPALPRATGAAL